MPAYVQYSLDSFIAEFFKRTSAMREACNEKAASLVGGSIQYPAKSHGHLSENT